MSLWGNWMVAWCCVQESSDIWWYFLSKQNPSVSSPAPQMCLECECINDITVRSDIGPRIIGLRQPADSVKGIPEWGVAMNTSFHFSANPQTTRFLFCPSATLRRYVAYLPHLSAHRPQNLSLFSPPSSCQTRVTSVRCLVAWGALWKWVPLEVSLLP